MFHKITRGDRDIAGGVMLQRLRILIAEDRDFVAWRLKGQLEAQGHQVLGVVKDGPAAAAAVSQSPPDLIFLDQHLPPHDGIEAARMILAQRIVPLVLLIGYPAAGLVRRAQEVGVLAYLVWPADSRELEWAIESAQTRFREFRILYGQIGDLQRALRARMTIGRAKVMLMRRLRIAEADAFSYVHRQSRRTGKPLEVVAADLSAAEEMWFGKSGFAGCIEVILGVLTRPRVLGPSQVA
jgi:two-component system, response regulator PdtaR